MDVRIGLTHNAKELQVQLDDDADPGAVRTRVDEALTNSGTLWLTDHKGRQVGVPAAKVAYVEILSPTDARRIGFGS